MRLSIKKKIEDDKNKMFFEKKEIAKRTDK